MGEELERSEGGKEENFTLKKITILCLMLPCRKKEASDWSHLFCFPIGRTTRHQDHLSYMRYTSYQVLLVPSSFKLDKYFRLPQVNVG